MVDMPELETTEGLINQLKSRFLSNLDSNSSVDKVFVENPELKDILYNYTLMTTIGVRDCLSEDYKVSLKQDIIEYKQDNVISDNFITLSKIAFFRLQKISRKHYLESIYGSEVSKIEDLKNQAEQIREEYEVLSAIA